MGSIIAAIIGSRTQEELDEFFSDDNFWDLLPDLTFFSGNDPMSVMKITCARALFTTLSSSSDVSGRCSEI